MVARADTVYVIIGRKSFPGFRDLDMWCECHGLPMDGRARYQRSRVSVFIAVRHGRHDGRTHTHRAGLNVFKLESARLPLGPALSQRDPDICLRALLRVVLYSGQYA